MKPGWKTTELWVTVLVSVGLVTAALAEALSPKWAGVAVAVSVAAYTLSRGLAKVNPPKD